MQKPRAPLRRGGGTPLRRSLDHWFSHNEVRPEIVGEFDDSALLKAFGEHGAGVFAGPTLVEGELCEIHGLEIIGRAPEIKERFYSITIERRIKHPATRAISDHAHRLFG